MRQQSKTAGAVKGKNAVWDQGTWDQHEISSPPRTTYAKRSMEWRHNVRQLQEKRLSKFDCKM